MSENSPDSLTGPKTKIHLQKLSFQSDRICVSDCAMLRWVSPACPPQSNGPKQTLIRGHWRYCSNDHVRCHCTDLIERENFSAAAHRVNVPELWFINELVTNNGLPKERSFHTCQNGSIILLNCLTCTGIFRTCCSMLVVVGPLGLPTTIFIDVGAIYTCTSGVSNFNFQIGWFFQK